MNEVRIEGKITSAPIIIDSLTRKTAKFILNVYDNPVPITAVFLKPAFIKCVAFNEIAKKIQFELKEGDEISLTGALQTSSYVVKGQATYVTEVHIDNFIKLSK